MDQWKGKIKKNERINTEGEGQKDKQMMDAPTDRWRKKTARR